jgi:SH3 domain protein
MRRGVAVFLVIACAVLVVPAASLHAKTMYVRDWIVVTIRAVPLDTSQSLGTVQTNDVVEVLEEVEGWSRIRSKTGVEGWVAGRFLSATPPKNLYAKQLEAKLKALQEENMRLRGTAPAGPPQGAGPVVAGTQGIAAPLEVSFADCTGLKAGYDKLQAQNTDCIRKSGLLAAENSRLRNSERLFFTFIGGVFIILGVLIGLFIQMATARSKKQGYKF